MCMKLQSSKILQSGTIFHYFYFAKIPKTKIIYHKSTDQACYNLIIISNHVTALKLACNTWLCKETAFFQKAIWKSRLYQNSYPKYLILQYFNLRNFTLFYCAHVCDSFYSICDLFHPNFWSILLKFLIHFTYSNLWDIFWWLSNTVIDVKIDQFH